MDTEKSPFLGSQDVVDESEMLDLTKSTKSFTKVRPKTRTILRVTCWVTVLVLIAAIFAAGILVGYFAIKGGVKNGGSSCGENVTAEICTNPPVLLISLDGFRSSYLTRGLTPNIQSLIDDGVRSEYMRSCFPTKTFPNHYSIVTGLYPESHGIISNSFWDSELQRYFYLGSADSVDSVWWKGEPIWVTAAKEKLVTGVYFWPGSEAEIKGYRPNYYFKYDGDTPYNERIDTVLGWLDLPADKRPQFLAAYFEEPDHSGHQGGPDSTLVNSALGRVDEAIGRLMTGLKKRNISDCVNMMIISDHGMSLFNKSLFVDVNDLLPHHLTSSGQVNYPSYGTTMNIDVNGGDEVVEEVYEALVANGTDVGYPFRVFHIRDLPLRLHTGHYNKHRYGSLFVIGDDHSFITKNKSLRAPPTGDHGHDNIEQTMQAIFLAHGPAFKRKHVAEPITNIQVYSLMCDLLNITAAPNNGTRGSLYDSLNPHTVEKLPPTESPGGSPGVTSSCPYPQDDSGTVCEECLCQGYCALDEETVLASNRKNFNNSASQESQYQARHFPWGVPPGGRGSSACILSQPSYINIYSNTLKIPLLVGYTQSGIASNGSGFQTCIRRDPRVVLSNSANCSIVNETTPSFGVDNGLPLEFEEEEGLNLTPLPLSLISSEGVDLSAMVLTAMAPFYDSLINVTWGPLAQLVNSWIHTYPTLNIMVGTVLDANKDGLRDSDSAYPNFTSGVAIPSHVYVVVTRCERHGVELGACPVDGLNALGMLFQNPPETGDYMDPQRVLRYSLTPLRDIEQVTGINFFPNLSSEDQNRLELRLVDELWPSSSH